MDDRDFERNLRFADIVMLETAAVFYQLPLQAPDLLSYQTFLRHLQCGQ